MKKPIYAIAIALLVTGSFVAGSWWSRRHATHPPPAADRKVLYYVDPMHPAYRSDKPGIAPDCGMELVPVYADVSPGGPGGVPVRAPGTVTVSAEKQQLIGVKVATVERGPASHTLRVSGRVVPDETRVYRVNSATDGWVRTILPFTSGSLIRKDELLATFFAPEFFSAIKAYLYGLRSLDRFAASRKETKEQLELTGANIDSYRNALRNLGMTEHQMDEIARTRRTPQNVEVRSPTAGFILARNISPGQRFEKGTELYRIADLGHVWILADLFENEGPFVQPGLVARVSSGRGARTFTARVGHVLPQFDASSRTLKVRLQADNPGYALRPDMFVDVEFPVSLPPALTVPADAVLDAGLRKTVFVDEGEGHFQPRAVETGWRLGDRVQVVKGLMEGERIVVSGTFLIDSESRMKAAAAGIVLPETDPVCGMQVDRGKSEASGRTRSYQGRTYYFCSDGCRKLFEASPAKYVPGASAVPATVARTAAPRPPAAPPVVSEPAVAPEPPPPAETEPGPPSADTETELESGMSTDPACGDIVERERAAAAGLKVEYEGQTYYFVTRECKELFESHPKQYVPDAGSPATVGPESNRAAAASTTATDPVCGREIDEAVARAAGRTSEHGGRTYVFCSVLCKERFEKDPARYAAKP